MALLFASRSIPLSISAGLQSALPRPRRIRGVESGRTALPESVAGTSKLVHSICLEAAGQVPFSRESTAYIERSNLTCRPFNGRQVCKTLAFAKEVAAYKAAAAWEDRSYDLARSHKSQRLPIADASPRKWLQRTPAMIARLTDHTRTVQELLTTSPIPDINNT